MFVMCVGSWRQRWYFIILWGCVWIGLLCGSGCEQTLPPSASAVMMPSRTRSLPRPLPVSFSKLAAWQSSFRVLTLNIQAGGQPHLQPLSRTVKLIQASRADIVILQESHLSAPQLAQTLGWRCQLCGYDVSILSRWPMRYKLSDGAVIQISKQQQLPVFGVRLKPYPYGPYEVRDHPSMPASTLVAQANRFHGPVIEAMLRQIRPWRARKLPVVLAGDFNEPSHLDWSMRAARAGLHFQRVVPWPTSLRLFRQGFRDVFRLLRPDEVRDPGETWTPKPNSKDVHDRIDMIYFQGPMIRPTAVQVIGPRASKADIVVLPYPTDHRAVVATFAWAPPI